MKIQLFIILFAILLTGCSKEDKPVACFDIVENYGEVCWDATCSVNASAYSWDLNPGTSSKYATGCYFFGIGEHKITLTVYSESGRRDTISREFVVDSVVNYYFSCIQCTDSTLNNEVRRSTLSSARYAKASYVSDFGCNCSEIEAR